MGPRRDFVALEQRRVGASRQSVSRWVAALTEQGRRGLRRARHLLALDQRDALGHHASPLEHHRVQHLLA